MKYENRTEIQIIRIPILPLSILNCFLIRSPKGCILVDTGLPGSEFRIFSVLKKKGLTFADIRLIVITHAHVDHAGSAARLRELSGAPILAHEGDLKYYRREEAMTFCNTGWFSPLFLKTGLIRQPYEAFQPDILLVKDEQFDLAPYGIAGCVKHSPGHTAGSLSMELGTRDALVGDLIASGIFIGGIAWKKHAIRPPFEDDPHKVSQELLGLVHAGMERFYIGHGGPILDANEVERHARKLMKVSRRN